MHNYRKLRLIQKGGFGMQLNSLLTDTSNASLTLTALDAVNLLILLSTQGIRTKYYLSLALTQGVPQLFNGLSNIGITTGNSTLASMGLLGTNLANAGLLWLNWNNLSGSERVSGVAGVAGQAVDTLDNMFFSKQHANDSALTKGLNTAYDSVSNSLMMFSPVGTLAGGAMKVGKFLGDGLSALGVGTDQMTTTDLVLDSSFMKLTPAGLINSLGAKRTQQFSANNDTIEKVGGSYGGSVATINDAVSKANKKYGLFSSGDRRKANALIDEARAQQDTMTNISNEYLDLLANKSDLAYTRYNTNINGGYLQQYVRAAKNGAILERILLRKHKTGGLIHEMINVDTKEIEWLPIINIDVNYETPKFKEGGELVDTKEIEWLPKIVIESLILVMAEGGKSEEKLETKEGTTLKNVIPEGALHARKHNMEHAEGLTKKGIPVIDNNGEQQAEVEKNEIILNLLLTKLLEEMLKKYSSDETTLKEKDEIALEAGKILVYEILYNTEDRTSLIKECKKGGVLDGHK